MIRINMQKKNFGLILGGGQGTRFWPWSTQEVPKQFLNIIGDDPLITQTYNRLKTFIPPENIYVVADIKYLWWIMDSIRGFEQSHLITEPQPRNTAPCLILANIYLSRIDEDANVLVVPSDHFIPDTKIFASQMKDALDAADDKCVVTCGIKPNIPHTGYGYIKFNEASSSKTGKNEFFEVMEFKEKPELPVAEHYLKAGNYYWNSGMFVYKLKHFKEFLGDYAPYYFIQYTELEKVAHHRLSFYETFTNIKAESIDYALMEKLPDVKMFKAKFNWNDLGSWSTVYQLNSKDEQNNMTLKKNNIFIDSKNSMIFSTNDKPVAAVGLKDIAVINTDNGVLVAEMKDLQRVREVIKKLEDQTDKKNEPSSW
jgi:mannose-1-phosphate guanylyltransferase